MSESNDLVQEGFDRKKIAVRFLFTILFVVVLEILKTIVQLTVLVQYVYLFITKKHSEPIRNFGNKVTTYAYRVMRYVCVNENRKPFPFTEFPVVVESAEEKVEF